MRGPTLMKGRARSKPDRSHKESLCLEFGLLVKRRHVSTCILKPSLQADVDMSLFSFQNSFEGSE
jgi:hypothetical protein